jgi:MFS family permease
LSKLIRLNLMHEIDNRVKEKMTIRDILGIRDYRFLWLGQIVSNFGDALTHLTLVLLINRISGGSTAAIAYLLIALALPQAVVGLFSGVAADRLDRKRIMIRSDILRGFLVLAFIVVGAGGTTTLWPLYVIAFLHASVGAFFLPARSATIPNIVPREALLSANSLSQISFVMFRVLGTAAAGLMVGLFDLFWPAFIIDAATFFSSALLISQIKHKTRRKIKSEQIPLRRNIRTIFSELEEGLSVIAHSKALSGTLVAAGVAMLGVGALSVLLPPYIVNDIGLSEAWFGVIDLAQVAGMLLSGSLITLLAVRFRPTNLISGGLLVLGLATAALSFASAIWQLLLVLFIVGLAATPINASIATLIQASVEDSMRGRILAALGAMVQVTSIISMLAAGTLAALIGSRSVFILSGLIAIAAGFLSAWVYRGFSIPGTKSLEAPAAEAVP